MKKSGIILFLNVPTSKNLNLCINRIKSDSYLIMCDKLETQC